MRQMIVRGQQRQIIQIKGNVVTVILKREIDRSGEPKSRFLLDPSQKRFVQQDEVRQVSRLGKKVEFRGQCQVATRFQCALDALEDVEVSLRIRNMFN